MLVENETEVRRIIGEIGGFRAYYLVRVDDGGGAVSVSVYDDRSGTEESNRVAAAWTSENVPGLSVSPPQVSAGEVAIVI